MSKLNRQVGEINDRINSSGYSRVLDHATQPSSTKT